MDVTITNRHMDLKGDEKGILTERLSHLSEKYLIKITSISSVVEKKKNGFFTEVIVQAKAHTFVGQAESEENIYIAIDDAVNKVEAQLRKHKDKLKHHKSKEIANSKKEGAFEEEDEITDE